MLKKFGMIVSIISILILTFIPLSYTINEINDFSDMNFAEFDVEVDY